MAVAIQSDVDAVNALHLAELVGERHVYIASDDDMGAGKNPSLLALLKVSGWDVGLKCASMECCGYEFRELLHPLSRLSPIAGRFG